MAAYFLLLGLLNLHFCTTFTLAASTRIGFIQEPRTDKECYEDGDSGYIITSFNSSVQQDRYMVAWNTSPDGKGKWIINGSTILVHDGAADHQTQDARWMVSLFYRSKSVTYKVKVTSLKFDTIPLIYPLIIDRPTGRIMTYSKVGVKFKIDRDCEDELSSSPTHTQPPCSMMTSNQTNNSSQLPDNDDSPSTTTQPDDFTSKVLDAVQNSHQLLTQANTSTKVYVMSIIIMLISLLHLFCPCVYHFIQKKCRQAGKFSKQKIKSEVKSEDRSYKELIPNFEY